MLKKGLLVIFWFPTVFVLIILNLTLLIRTVGNNNEIAKNIKGVQITSPSGTAQVLGTNIIAGDSRALLLNIFLDRYKSPMAPYAQLIVDQADLNNLDYRLLPAIAMCESNLGLKIPKGSFNPFGIAVYTGLQKGKQFDDWEHAISWVSQYIKKRYFDQNIRDLKDIGSIWAPPSVQNGDSWANCVESYLDRII